MLRPTEMTIDTEKRKICVNIQCTERHIRNRFPAPTILHSFLDFLANLADKYKNIKNTSHALV